MATVKHVEHPDGSHSVGVEIDGVYHPFATVSGARIEQNRERVEDLREKAKAGDEHAQEVLAQATGESTKETKG